MTLIRLNLILFVCLSLNPAFGQDLEQVKSDLMGTWRLDIDRTREEYEPLKKFISNKRVKLFEEFLLYYEVYQWTFKEEIMSISFRVSGRNLPSQNAKWELKKKDFTQKEDEWIGRSPLFNDWAMQEDVVWVEANKQGRVIIKLSLAELIVFDEGTPLVFGKVD